MKFLSFADPHGYKEYIDIAIKRSEKADFVLCAGDLTIFETNLKKIVKDLSKIKKNVYLVHGNHESKSALEKESKKYKNVHFVHKKVIRIDDVTIFCYGGGGFSYKDKEFEHFIEKNKSKLTKKNILMTHQPPFGTEIDKIFDDTHVGSKSVKKYLKYFDIAISGHIHEGFDKQEMVKKTLVIDPGPKGKLLKL